MIHQYIHWCDFYVVLCVHGEHFGALHYAIRCFCSDFCQKLPWSSYWNRVIYLADAEKLHNRLPWYQLAHWLVECTLECHWLTQCTLGYHWATQRILAGYSRTPLEKLSWNIPSLECHWRNLVEAAPHGGATGETLTFAAYTGTPLEDCNSPHTPRHI